MSDGSASSPGLAAILSGLFPGLGQLYAGRWVRGLLMVLIPALGVTLVGAFALYADPITDLFIRRAQLAALLVVGGLFAYHVVVVGDAFAGASGQGLRRRHIIDHALLGLVTLSLVLGYGYVYRETRAWASVLGAVFEPVVTTVVLPASVAEQSPPPQWTGTDRLTVLILGIDRRADAQTQNTDSVIVVSLDPLNRTASMLSIPRDTYVAIPGYGEDKINAAYARGGTKGGPELARRTVEGLLGIPIHAYALIDFDAFTRIVDAFGGVYVDVRRPVRDEEYPTADSGIERVAMLPGPQFMDGRTALQYARTRHDSNDFARARRQQDVVQALRTRLAQGGLARLPGILETVGSAVQTNFDPANVLPLARTGVALGSDALRSEVLLPCHISAPHCELIENDHPLGYYLFPDKAKLRDLVAQLFYDPKVRQEGAHVEVRATGARPAQATTVADRLEARAFGIAKRTSGASATSAVVLRNGAKRYSAERLAEQLGLRVITDGAETTDADVVVRIGSDFRGFTSDRS